MVLSAATAIYVGTTSYSKAYIGETQVWPATTSSGDCRVTKLNTISEIKTGDIIIIANGNNIITTADGVSWQSKSFSDFRGSGIYNSSDFPADTALLKCDGNRFSVKYYNGYNWTYAEVKCYAYDNNNMYLSRNGNYTVTLKNSPNNDGVKVYTYPNATGAYEAYLSSGNPPSFRRYNPSGNCFVYKYELI